MELNDFSRALDDIAPAIYSIHIVYIPAFIFCAVKAEQKDTWALIFLGMILSYFFAIYWIPRIWCFWMDKRRSKKRTYGN